MCCIHYTHFGLELLQRCLEHVLGIKRSRASILEVFIDCTNSRKRYSPFLWRKPFSKLFDIAWAYFVPLFFSIIVSLTQDSETKNFMSINKWCSPDAAIVLFSLKLLVCYSSFHAFSFISSFSLFLIFIHFLKIITSKRNQSGCQ